MFYEEKEISELIICPYCKTKFTDPRLLPCGVSLCYDCIQLLDKSGNIECVCNNIHAIPVDGFIVNPTLAKLVEKKPYEVYRSSLVEEFKQNLNILKQEIDFLTNKMQLGGENITEYCNSIKNEIQLKTEKTIEAIKQHSLDILLQIDYYQMECLSNYPKNGTQSKNLKLKNVEQFYDKWCGYLSNHSITEDEILNANGEIFKRMDDIYREHDEFKCKLFGDNLIRFEENQNPLDFSLIGHILFESSNLTKSIKQINRKENIINCTEFIQEPSLVDLADLSENEIYVITNEIQNGIIVMFTIAHEGNLVKQIEIMPPENTIEIKNLKLETINKGNNLELVYLFTTYQLPNKFKYITRVYNQNLDFLFEKVIKYRYFSITVYNKNIFSLLFDCSMNCCILCVYDEDLNELERFGQPNQNLPFYFSNNTLQVLVNKSYFVFLDDNGFYLFISIMDRKSGNVLKSFPIENRNSYINLHLERFILVYFKNSEYLWCFDLKRLEKIEVNRTVYQIERQPSSNLHLIECNNKNVFFFDYTNRLFIYS